MKIVINNLALSFNFLIIIALMGFGSTIGAQSDNTGTKSIATPPIQATVTVTSSCKKGRTCGSWAFSPSKVNAVTITNLTTTLYPSLEYLILLNTNGSGTVIANFTCNQTSVTFASPLLTNGQTFCVLLKSGSNFKSYAFTNGNENGKACSYTQSPTIIGVPVPDKL